MARPSAEVLMSAGCETGVTTEILKGKGVWTLAYNGQPVQIREQFFNSHGLQYHYPRSIYSNPGHCHNLAAKMNEQFGTLGFECIELVTE